MVQYRSRSPLEALRIGDAAGELARISSTPAHTPIGFDLETTGKNPRVDKLVMVQLKPRGLKGVYLDARDEDRGALRQALLPLLRDRQRSLVGQNLLFELHWMLSYLGMEVSDLRARFEDTMLRELVILGIGFEDAAKRGLAVNLHDIGDRYGVPVHKEEQSWFINLDKPRWFYADGSYSFGVDKRRVFFHADHTVCESLPDGVVRESDEQWSQPFPQKILEYGRQDVSVVHLIAEKQQATIEEYHLQEVIDLEARVLPAVAGMQHYGLSIDREKWLGVLAGIDQRAEELAAELHTYVDVPVVDHRRRVWQASAQPYQAWVRERDSLVADAKVQWESVHEKGWKEEKKAILDTYAAHNPRPKNPGPLKQGVNLNSSDQMLIALQSRGHQIAGTAEEALTPLAAGDPVVQLLLDYREYNTARVKYGQVYLDEHAPNDTIYTSIQQLGTETGRFSMKKPNVQQVPAKGAGAALRTAIVSRPGYVFVDFDLSNIELRTVADIARDPVMLNAFKSGEDLHAKTAEVMFRLRENPSYVGALDKEAWTKKHNAVVGGKEINGVSYRAIAKTINFGLLYGMGAGRLAATLRISVSDAKVLMRLYRETYAVTVAWLRQQGQRVEEPDEDDRVFAATLAGRRRWFQLPGLSVDKNTTAEEARAALDEQSRQIAAIQRQLGNHPIQGTSADTIKLSIALWQERYNSPKMRLVCAVHDELLIEVEDTPETVVAAREHLAEVMREAFSHFLKVVVPGPIDGPTSTHWEQH